MYHLRSTSTPALFNSILGLAATLRYTACSRRRRTRRSSSDRLNPPRWNEDSGNDGRSTEAGLSSRPVPSDSYWEWALCHSPTIDPFSNHSGRLREGVQASSRGSLTSTFQFTRLISPSHLEFRHGGTPFPSFLLSAPLATHLANSPKSILQSIHFPTTWMTHSRHRTLPFGSFFGVAPVPQCAPFPVPLQKRKKRVHVLRTRVSKSSILPSLSLRPDRRPCGFPGH